MYAVVGCGECSALWVVEGEPETTGCPRCGTRHQYAKLKRFVETDDEAHAREVRASMLANRRGEGEAFAALDSYEELGEHADGGVVDDDEYLSAAGLDVDEVAAAGDRATNRGSSRSRRETVVDALRALDEPTEDDVVEYAAEHGVSPEYAREALAKLVRAGEASESRGRYRLV
jgi:predicted  nucleic acid-binding Zn-ribbon protein